MVLLCAKASQVLCLLTVAKKLKLDVEVSELVLTTVFSLQGFCTVTHTERHMYSKATYR